MSFVPLEGVTPEGDDLLIPWDQEQVKAAPQVDDDGDGHLAPEEEVQLYRHYAEEQRSAAGDDDNVRGEGTADNRASDREATGHERTKARRFRSLEDRQPRLRKYVVTKKYALSRVCCWTTPRRSAQEPSNGPSRRTHLPPR